MMTLAVMTTAVCAAGRLTVPTNGEQLRRKSYDLAADGGKSNRLGHLLNRLNLPAAM